MMWYLTPLSELNSFWQRRQRYLPTEWSPCKDTEPTGSPKAEPKSSPGVQISGPAGSQGTASARIRCPCVTHGGRGAAQTPCGAKRPRSLAVSRAVIYGDRALG